MFEKLRQMRKARKITGEEMAKKLGIQKAGYSKKERGSVAFTLQDAKKVSDVLGMSIDDIFFPKEVSSGDTDSA